MSILGKLFEWIYLLNEKNVELATILFCFLLKIKQKVIDSHCLLFITFCDFLFLKSDRYIFTLFLSVNTI
jgi:hypothetical protein